MKRLLLKISTGTILRPLAVMAAIITLTALSASAAMVNLSVGGVADIFLAGQPNGATLGSDTAPTNSPVLGSAGLTLISGQFLTFSATGSTNYGGCPSNSPDALNCGNFTFAGNNLGNFTGPANALIGVFLSSGVPPGPAPLGLDFSSAAAQSASLISPLLYQVFFIGDGLTGTASGTTQNFTIPAGATRLFLGSADSAGTNFNNSGSYSVSVSDGIAASTGTPEPGTLYLMVSALIVAGLATARRRRLT